MLQSGSGATYAKALFDCLHEPSQRQLSGIVPMIALSRVEELSVNNKHQRATTAKEGLRVIGGVQEVNLAGEIPDLEVCAVRWQGRAG